MLPFDIEQLKQSSVLLSGCNSSGKTNFSCSLASKLQKLGYVVKVIDVSGIWKQLSDIPLYVVPTIEDNQIKLPAIAKNQSVIYDLSTLKLSQVKQVVDAISLKLWDERINAPLNKPTFLFLEESEIFCKNIRGKESESIFRLVHVGRNCGVRCILITTDLALIDASIIRLCLLRLHGAIAPEENSKRKFRAYYGKDWLRIALEALEAGTFIRFNQYDKKQPLTIKNFQEFKPKSKPRRYYTPMPTIKTTFEPTIKEDKLSFWEVFKALVNAPFTLLDGGISTNINTVKHSKTFELFNHEEEQDSELEEDFILIEEED